MRPVAATMAFFAKILVFSFGVGILAATIQTGSLPTFSDAVISGLSGMLIGFGCSAVEIFGLSNRSIRWLRRTPFFMVVGFRAIAYCLIIFFGLVSPSLAIRGEQLWTQPDFQKSFWLSSLIATGISFSIELGRLLGKEATLALFTGRYRRPRIENRIVVFADLVGSTALAETVGDIRFHQLLNDVSHDLSLPIERNGGETHRYVGDAVIITWPMSRRNAFEKSLSCAEEMIECIARQRPDYETKYGSAVRLRIALHCGRVAAGEIGYWKKEIALLGDTMNTAARIEGAARQYGESILISDAVADRLSTDLRHRLKPVPDFQAVGKHDPLKLWALDELSN